MTNDQLFNVTLQRLRDLPGLSAEPQQDLDNLQYLYLEARRDQERAEALASKPATN